MGWELTRRGAMAAGLSLALSARAYATDSPIASTSAGRIRGYVDDGVLAFRGVRYGADTAPRRFQPPAPPTPWANIAETIDYGPASPQRNAGAGRMSEDCLVLNVFTPALRDGARRPVMVYIHGGAYSNGSGSSPLYDGVRLCRRGNVVVVSLNHRLNAFGYAYLARLVPELAD
ncbi:MAG TPA: carboxylesterase family protein, partial [Phenylobacterium sp.]